VHLISDIDLAGHRINSTLLLAMLAVLVAWIVVYMIYKMFWHADFGLPVRRRLLARGLSIERDQVAFAPLWWSDLQIQHAVSTHWKNSLRSTVKGAPDRHAEEPAAR
jgi:hypothetical protein